MIFQRAPFQCSTRVFMTNELFCENPTAHASVEDAADTALSAEEADPEGIGLATTLQLVPFQCSVRPAELRPTAHTSLEETADTPARKEPAVPTLGLGTMDHDVPFQCW